MDALTQFQHSFAEPVNGFVASYWPVLLVAGVGIASWFFTPRWRDRDGVVINMSLEGEGSDDDGGGDGGGGDGGGGGD